MPTLATPDGKELTVHFADEADYGVAPGGNWIKTPVYSMGLRAQRPMEADPILGVALATARDATEPAPALTTHGGSLAVPLDLRHIGYWLKLFFGPPATAGLVAATGSILFSGQPADGATITIAGTPFTFVDTAPTGNQIEIGANLAATLTNIATALNGSAVPAVAAATYAASGGNRLTITHDTPGAAGNVFALAAATGSNGTPSGATLSGGANSHVFTSGAVTLPSRAIADVIGGHISHHLGLVGRTMQFALGQEAGNRRVTIALGGRDQVYPDVAGIGTPAAALARAPFAAARGSLKLDGAVVANLLALDATYDTKLEEERLVDNSDLVSGWAPGADEVEWAGSLRLRWQDRALEQQALAGGASAMALEYALSAGLSLTLASPKVSFARSGPEIAGPGRIENSVDFRAWQTAAEPMLTATLVNDVGAY